MASTGFGPDFYNIVLKKSQDSLGDFNTFLEQTGRRIQNGQPSPSLTSKPFYANPKPEPSDSVVPSPMPYPSSLLQLDSNP
jgi:hypothetical protein